jgi:Protein kinase domain
MELIDGENLHHAVTEGRFPPEETVPLVLRVGDALAEAHEQGIVHRDVKPTNILLDTARLPKLTDFDLVAATDTTAGTPTGALGTFLFAAPEQMQGAGDAGAPADVYGLGMTAIFCLHGDDLPVTVLRSPEQVVAGLPCNGGVKRVLLRAVEVMPEGRFSDARAFCAALREASDVSGEPMTEAEAGAAPGPEASEATIDAAPRAAASTRPPAAAPEPVDIAAREVTPLDIASLKPNELPRAAATPAPVAAAKPRQPAESLTPPAARQPPFALDGEGWARRSQDVRVGLPRPDPGAIWMAQQEKSLRETPDARALSVILTLAALCIPGIAVLVFFFRLRARSAVSLGTEGVTVAAGTLLAVIAGALAFVMLRRKRPQPIDIGGVARRDWTVPFLIVVAFVVMGVVTDERMRRLLLPFAYAVHAAVASLVGYQCFRNTRDRLPDQVSSRGSAEQIRFKAFGLFWTALWGTWVFAYSLYALGALWENDFQLWIDFSTYLHAACLWLLCRVLDDPQWPQRVPRDLILLIIVFFGIVLEAQFPNAWARLGFGLASVLAYAWVLFGFVRKLRSKCFDVHRYERWALFVYVFAQLLWLPFRIPNLLLWLLPGMTNLVRSPLRHLAFTSVFLALKLGLYVVVSRQLKTEKLAEYLVTTTE